MKWNEKKDYIKHIFPCQSHTSNLKCFTFLLYIADSDITYSHTLYMVCVTEPTVSAKESTYHQPLQKQHTD